MDPYPIPRHLRLLPFPQSGVEGPNQTQKYNSRFSERSCGQAVHNGCLTYTLHADGSGRKDWHRTTTVVIVIDAERHRHGTAVRFIDVVQKIARIYYLTQLCMDIFVKKFVKFQRLNLDGLPTAIRR